MFGTIGFGLRHGARFGGGVYFYYMENMNQKEFSKTTKFVFNYCLFMLSDVIHYPLQKLESRYILQNCRQNFRTFTFDNFSNSFQNMVFRNYLRGYSAYFFINLVDVSSFQFMVYDIQELSYLKVSLWAFLINYPLLTAVRRLQCESKDVGMIQQRYSGVFHALKLILKEEGFKGLYRGIVANSIAHFGSRLTMIYFLKNKNKK